MARVLVLSGAGRYADPWHDFPATSARVATLLRGLGHQVAVAEAIEGALLDLDRVDLLVINIGNPGDGRPDPGSSETERALLRYADNGGAILALHTATTTFTTFAAWPEIIGGQWIRGTSMHPAIGPGRIHRTGEPHPVAAGLADFELYDERYSFLALRPGNVVLFDHEHDGRRHPLVWARQRRAGRTVYDGLGHGVESYASPDHQRLLRASAAWLVGCQQRIRTMDNRRS
jgi:hypothetical protein